MSAPALLIDAVLAASLAPALKAAGYRKSARTWRRSGPASVRVVNAQGSAWNDAATSRFTVNLGLYFPALAPFVAWGRTAERPTEPDCQVRQRIGFLLPERQDHWWIVTPATDLAVVAAEVRAAWDQCAAPWLDAHDNLMAARPLVAQQYVHGDPAVSLALGDRPDAARRFEAQLTAATGRVQREALLAWGRQHDLLPIAVQRNAAPDGQTT